MATGVAVFLVLFVFGWAMSPSDTMPNDAWQVLMMVGGSLFLLVGVFWSCLLSRRAMKRQLTDLTIESSLEGSQVLTWIGCNHWPSFRESWYQRIFGGVLVLTDTELVFQTDLLQFRNYELRFPLHELASVESHRAMVFFGGLKVHFDDGTKAVFDLALFGGGRRVEALVELIDRTRLRLRN